MEIKEGYQQIRSSDGTPYTDNGARLYISAYVENGGMEVRDENGHYYGMIFVTAARVLDGTLVFDLFVGGDGYTVHNTDEGMRDILSYMAENRRPDPMVNVAVGEAPPEPESDELDHAIASCLPEADFTALCWLHDSLMRLRAGCDNIDENLADLLDPAGNWLRVVTIIEDLQWSTDAVRQIIKDSGGIDVPREYSPEDRRY